MPRFIRPILAVVLGFVIGSAVNMAFIMLSGKVIAPPAGADIASMDGLTASIHLFEPKHFIFPFLAHAVGTMVGAFVATMLVRRVSATPAYVVGGLFLLGGIANAVMLPAPTWFTAADLLLAYLPAAWLGHNLAMRTSRRAASVG